MGDGDQGTRQAPNSSDQDRRLLGQGMDGAGARPRIPVPVHGPNVQIGDDRVIPDSPNWAGMSHQQLYDGVHQGNNPSDAQGLAREWTALGQEMSESSRALGDQVRGTESGWRGSAAEAARKAISELVAWSETAAKTSSQMADRIADQAQIAEQAKTAMPEPVHFDAAQELANAATTGGLSGLLAAGADVKQKSDQARSAHDDAVRVMQTMESNSRQVDGNTPQFTPPPQVINGASADAGPLQSTSADQPQRPTPVSAPLLHPVTQATGGGNVPDTGQPGSAPLAAQTVSAAAGPAAMAQASPPLSPDASQAPAATAGTDAAYGGAAALSGGVTAAASAPSATQPTAPGGSSTGAPGSTGTGSGSSGASAGTVKFQPVGGPSAGGSGVSAPAATTAASYTPPPAVSGSQQGMQGYAGGFPPPSAGQDQAGGVPAQGWQPGMSGPGGRGSDPSGGSSPSNRRPGAAPGTPGAPGGQSAAPNQNSALSNQMRDPNYWAQKLGSGTGGTASPQQDPSSAANGQSGQQDPRSAAGGHSGAQQQDPKSAAGGHSGAQQQDPKSAAGGHSGAQQGTSAPNQNQALSNEMRDPNYWAQKLGPGADGTPPPQQDPSSVLGGHSGPAKPDPSSVLGGQAPPAKPDPGSIPGGHSAPPQPDPRAAAGAHQGAPAPNPNQALSNEMRDPNYWAQQLGTGAGGGSSPQGGMSGLAGGGTSAVGGVGSAHLPGGGFTSMSGELPPAGTAGTDGTAAESYQAQPGGGAPGAPNAGSPGAQGGAAMGPMGAGAGAQGSGDQVRKSRGYFTGEKIVEEPGRVPPAVFGETFKKKKFNKE